MNRFLLTLILIPMIPFVLIMVLCYAICWVWFGIFGITIDRIMDWYITPKKFSEREIAKKKAADPDTKQAERFFDTKRYM